MSEQLHQNKNIQNDDSAFDPDLYQDFDAEAGVQADLAAFNEQMESIKNASWISDKEMERGRQETRRTQLDNARQQLALARSEGTTGEELVAKARDLTAAIPAKNKYDIVNQDKSGKSSSESQEPEQTTSEPEQTSEADAQSGESATPAKKKLMDRLRGGTREEREEAKRLKENLRNAQRDAERTRNGTSVADAWIAHNRTNSESQEPARASSENEENTRTTEVSPDTPPAAQAQPTGEDAPGNVPREERVAQPAPRRRNRHAAAAATAQAAATTDQASGRAPLLGEAGVTSEGEAPDLQPTADTAGQIFLTGPEEEAPRPRPRIPEVTIQPRPNAAITDFLGGSAPAVPQADSEGNGADIFFRSTEPEAAAVPEPDTEPLPRMTTEELQAEGRRRGGEAERQYGQPLSPQTETALRAAGSVQMGVPVHRGTVRPLAEPATAEPAPSTPENPDSVYIPAYDPSSLVAGADPYSHMYAPDTDYASPSTPENPDTTPVTPEVTATPENPSALLDAAVSQLGQRYAFNYQEDKSGRQRLIITDKNSLDTESTDRAVVVNINLDRAHTNEQYLSHQLEALRKLAEKELPRRERAKLAIGRMLSRSEVARNERSDARAQAREARQERRQQRREERELNRRANGSFMSRHGSKFVLGATGIALAGGLAGYGSQHIGEQAPAEAAPGVSASPTPGASQESPTPSPSKSSSPSASESTKPSASASPSEKESSKPSASPTQEQPSDSTPVNPNRPNAPEPGQGGSGSTGSQERTESNPHEDLTFSADGKKVTAKLKSGGTIFEAGHDADLTDAQIMNAVQAAGITPSQAASLQPGQIVDFTQSGNGSYVVKLR